VLAIVLILSAFADNWRSLNDPFAEIIIVPKYLLITHGDVIFGLVFLGTYESRRIVSLITFVVAIMRKTFMGN